MENNKYNPAKIEKKWQNYWKSHGIYKTNDTLGKKFYVLDMFPYPSGSGLHVGHPKGYIATDVYARYMMLNGANVLHPMGFDSFGLPAENYAIKHKVHPQKAVDENIKTFKNQLKKFGFSYDWDREIITSDPAYYKWTQWIFIQLFNAGLAYESFEPINWCPSCKTGLANEDLEDGKCERCGSKIEKKPLRQWVLKITDYAERLLSDLKLVNWEKSIVDQQINWIGRSEGSLIDFNLNVFNKVLLATTNEAKVKRIKKLFKLIYPKIAILTPNDLNISSILVQEGNNLIQNATKKAGAYFNKVDMPIIGTDTAFYIEDEEIDPAQVKRNSLKGMNEAKLTQEEIANLMVRFYQKIAQKRGGKVNAYWKDVFCIKFPDGTKQIAESRREVLLTDKIKGKIDIHVPIRCMYISKATNKYIFEQSESDELVELKPVMDALSTLLPKIQVFTTRADTLFGASYVVLAPEHQLIKKLEQSIKNWKDVQDYINKSKNKSDLERTELQKIKTGIEIKGIKAINPANNEELPIYVADYVLLNYGTGAVMAVPAHDERDFEFATKYHLQIKTVITKEKNTNLTKSDLPFTENGYLVNSQKFDGLTSDEAKKSITKFVSGKDTIKYKMRDWVFSRQRYWGEPIPIIHCEKCGAVAVPEKDLPVRLPDISHYEPTGTGESPLAAITGWVNTECPKCGEKAKRETNTMPQWAGSSWYYLRYIDPKNNKRLVDTKKEKYWMEPDGVDLYIGGAEHATRHLLYARFWHKFLYDQGFVSTKEPFHRLQHVGLLLGEDGRKMSKRWGNVINPDDVIAEFGADAFRVYEMFMGPFTDSIAWSTAGVKGTRRFLESVYKYSQMPENNNTNFSELQKTINKVTEDIKNLRFNTAISAMMIYINAAISNKVAINKKEKEKFIQILSPFAPHIAEEVWADFNNKQSIFVSTWPNIKVVKDSTVKIAVQINGKVRAILEVNTETPEKELIMLATKNPIVKKWLSNKKIKKTIYIAGKVISFVLE